MPLQPMLELGHHYRKDFQLMHREPSWQGDGTGYQTFPQPTHCLSKSPPKYRVKRNAALLTLRSSSINTDSNPSIAVEILFSQYASLSAFLKSMIPSTLVDARRIRRSGFARLPTSDRHPEAQSDRGTGMQTSFTSWSSSIVTDSNPSIAVEMVFSQYASVPTFLKSMIPSTLVDARRIGDPDLPGFQRVDRHPEAQSDRGTFPPPVRPVGSSSFSVAINGPTDFLRLRSPSAMAAPLRTDGWEEASAFRRGSVTFTLFLTELKQHPSESDNPDSPTLW